MDRTALQARIDAVDWYHEFDFGNGLATRSRHPISPVTGKYGASLGNTWTRSTSGAKAYWTSAPGMVTGVFTLRNAAPNACLPPTTERKTGPMVAAFTSPRNCFSRIPVFRLQFVNP